jgi:hypothetical protein
MLADLLEAFLAFFIKLLTLKLFIVSLVPGRISFLVNSILDIELIIIVIVF